MPTSWQGSAALSQRASSQPTESRLEMSSNTWKSKKVQVAGPRKRVTYQDQTWLGVVASSSGLA